MAFWGWVHGPRCSVLRDLKYIKIALEYLSHHYSKKKKYNLKLENLRDFCSSQMLEIWMKKDSCIFMHRVNFKARCFLRSFRKKKILQTRWREPSCCRSMCVAVLSDRLGHLPLFPEGMPAFREKSDLKGSSWASAARRKAQQGRGSSAEHGDTAGRRRLHACLRCSITSPAHPVGHTAPRAAFSSSAGENCGLASGFG